MLMNKEEAESRLASPDNLMNRLRLSTSRNHNTPFGLPVIDVKSTPVTVPPKIEDLVDGIEDKLKFNGIKGKALDVLDRSLDELNRRVSEVENVAKLSGVIDTMNRVINGSSENARKTPEQLIVWQPIMIQENHYETIHVSE